MAKKCSIKKEQNLAVSKSPSSSTSPFSVTALHSPTSDLSFVYSWSLNHPLLLANLLFFLNANVLFWVIGLLQSSQWARINNLQDVTHLLQFLSFDFVVVVDDRCGLDCDTCNVGSLLCGASFRRIFLIGIFLPLYVIHSVDAPLNIWDFICTVICLTWIIMMYYAHTQLHEFVTKNQKLKEQGKPKIPNLDTGLWYCSRHPNYLGEQMWWWGLVIFAWNLGQGWTLIGAFGEYYAFSICNNPCRASMLKQEYRAEYRAEAYRAFQKTTSVWIS